MPLDYDASGLEDILGLVPNPVFQHLADAGFLSDLIPILPPDAFLTAASEIENKDCGKIPGQYLHNGTWRGFPKWSQHVATQASVSEWSTWPACGCGLIGRQVKAFDLDINDASFAERADARLVKILGPAPSRIGRPPRRLLVYRCGELLGKVALVLRKDGKECRVEFLGAKQQFVVEGIHPKTGKPYYWPRGDLTAVGLSGLTSITPHQVEEALAGLEAMAVTEGYEVHRLGRVKTVGETLDLRVPDYLPTDGINVPRARSAFERHLLKWAAGIREGQRDDAVYQCAASLFDFIADKDIVARWMKAELWPLIDGDDFTETQFDKCVEQGRICRQNSTGTYAAGASQDVFGEAAARMVKESSASILDDDEEPLDVFDNDAASAEFPSGALPGVLEDFARDESLRKGVDVGTIVLPALVACAGALHSQFQIQHTNDTSWTQRPVLWGMLVGDPSTVKTPVMRAAMKPLEDLQRRWFHQDKGLFAQYRRDHAEWHAAYSKKLDNIKWAGKDVASTLAGSDVGVEPMEPPKHRLVIKNATVEAMADVLANNGERGILSYRNELAGWITSFDRYVEKKGGDQTHWLEAWDSEPQLIDRKGNKTGVTHIENWSVSVLGSIQPSRLKPMAAQLSEDGLLQRFLVCWASLPRRGEDRPPGSAAGAYAAMLRRLTELKPIAEAGRGFVPIRLSAEARQHWLRVQEHIQDKITIHRESHGAFCEHLGKWPNQFARLLLVLHAIEAVAEMPSATLQQPKLPLLVSGATAQRAARLAIRFLIPSAERFYKEVFGVNAEWGHVQWIASYILTSGPEKIQIRPRDIYRNYRALNSKNHARDLQEAMQSLEHRNWLRPLEAAPGRGTVLWDINSLVHVRFAEFASSEQRRKALIKVEIEKAARMTRERWERDGRE